MNVLLYNQIQFSNKEVSKSNYELQENFPAKSYTEYI